MKISSKLFILIILITSKNIFSQNPQLIQLDQCIQQLEQLSKYGTWDDVSFVSNFEMFLNKGKSIYFTLKKQSVIEGLQERKISLDNFEKVLKSKGKAEVEESKASSKNGLKGLFKSAKGKISKLRGNMMSDLYERVEDDGIGNDFHKNNLSNIKFGDYTYGGNENGLKNSFNINEGFNYYLFLPKAIHNIALDELEKNGEDRWLAKSENQIHFKMYLNGEFIHKWIEVSPSDREVNEKATFIEGICIDKNKNQDVNYAHRTYRYLGKDIIVERLKPGKYNIKLEAYLVNNTINWDGAIKLSEGSFNFNVSEADLVEFKKYRNQLVRVERTIMNGCSHTMIIDKVRGKYSGERKEYKSGITNSVAYDEGDKLYVINPVTGKRKFLMTVEKGTKTINFDCNW
ncbi:hypothetical protein [Polaribacter sp.]|uniref:hypothetical protein n=1 Tax=Polaribacter sp. TaxID=1920175 RepID=UPI004048557F